MWTLHIHPSVQFSIALLLFVHSLNSFIEYWIAFSTGFHSHSKTLTGFSRFSFEPQNHLLDSTLTLSSSSSSWIGSKRRIKCLVLLQSSFKTYFLGELKLWHGFSWSWNDGEKHVRTIVEAKSVLEKWFIYRGLGIIFETARIPWEDLIFSSSTKSAAGMKKLKQSTTARRKMKEMTLKMCKRAGVVLDG